MSANLYAPPKAALEAQAAGGYWRDGKNVVLRPGGILPARCVRCNEPAVLPMKPRKVYWHHAAWYLLVLVNIVVYVIVALIIRRRAEVTYGVCARHRLRRRIFIGIGWGGLILGLGLLLAREPIGIFLGLVAALVGLSGSRLAYPARITAEEVRLAGCGAPFLAGVEQDALAATPQAPPAAAA